MSLIQEDVAGLKQAFVDGKCQVGRPTRKSPTKKSPRAKGETGVHKETALILAVVLTTRSAFEISGSSTCDMPF